MRNIFIFILLSTLSLYYLYIVPTFNFWSRPSWRRVLVFVLSTEFRESTTLFVWDSFHFVVYFSSRITSGTVSIVKDEQPWGFFTCYLEDMSTCTCIKFLFYWGVIFKIEQFRWVQYLLIAASTNLWTNRTIWIFDSFQQYFQVVSSFILNVQVRSR